MLVIHNPFNQITLVVYHFKLCKLGDENTSFLHTSASARLRKNQIRVLHNQNTPIYSHDGKAQLLHDFYKNLLGTSTPVTWNFSLHELYPSGPNLNHINAMLTDEEIKQALMHMRTDSSPGPDGFGPAFFKKFWNIVQSDITELCRLLQ